MTWVTAAVIAAALMHGGSAIAADRHSAKNDIPPRRQWNANFGYCGETSFISAGLYYGQYISQYEARRLASNGLDQSKSRSQLLLGGNDRRAAAKMHLTAVEWDSRKHSSAAAFLAWVKRNVVRGYPVAIGVYTNEFRFYGDTDRNAGDPAYDHIVPVVRVRSNHSLTDHSYHGGDTLTFSDNGLWGPPTPYLFTYEFGAFRKNRRQANAPSGPIYSLADDGPNYGIAITGIMDTHGDTVPVRVATDVNYERPAMKNGSNARPAPMPLTLTITVSGLTPGVQYIVYRYDDMELVPNHKFNANASNAKASWNVQIASGSDYTMTEHIMSDEIAVYRAVPAAAP